MEDENAKQYIDLLNVNRCVMAAVIFHSCRVWRILHFVYGNYIKERGERTIFERKTLGCSAKFGYFYTNVFTVCCAGKLMLHGIRPKLRVVCVHHLFSCQLCQLRKNDFPRDVVYQSPLLETWTKCAGIFCRWDSITQHNEIKGKIYPYIIRIDNVTYEKHSMNFHARISLVIFLAILFRQKEGITCR